MGDAGRNRGTRYTLDSSKPRKRANGAFEFAVRSKRYEGLGLVVSLGFVAAFMGVVAGGTTTLLLRGGASVVAAALGALTMLAIVIILHSIVSVRLRPWSRSVAVEAANNRASVEASMQLSNAASLLTASQTVTRMASLFTLDALAESDPQLVANVLSTFIRDRSNARNDFPVVEAVSPADEIESAVRILSKIARNHNLAVSLRGADLAGMKLPGETLAGFDLSYCNLSGADLSFANLARCDLRVANLHLTRMDGADLAHSIFDETNLAGASLIAADLSESLIRSADLTDANISRANFLGARLGNVCFDRIMSDEVKNLVLPTTRSIFDATGLRQRGSQ